MSLSLAVGDGGSHTAGGQWFAGFSFCVRHLPMLLMNTGWEGGGEKSKKALNQVIKYNIIFIFLLPESHAIHGVTTQGLKCSTYDF